VRVFLTSRTGRVFAAVVLIAVLSGAALFAADYAVIKVNHRPAVELVDAVRSLLSPEGTVIADDRNNTLVIMDNPAVLKQCRELVTSLDVASRHVRLRVTFYEAQDRREVDLSVRWRYRDGGFMIGNFEDGRGGEGLTVGGFGGAVAAGKTSVTTQDLLVMSGGSGRFVTGADVPISDDVLIRFRDHGIVREGVIFREVSTGFIFTPTILDTEVHLDITPFFSYFADGEEGSIVFYEAATTVSIPDGRTVVIAENETDTGRLVGDILSGFSKSVMTGSFYISVTPQIEE
jgi:type II secretory pathway component GspD/PulD (secretin)